MTIFEKAPEQIVIRPMLPDDAERVAALYLQIAVTKDNYRERLSEGENSFQRRGGMFLINDAERMRAILADDAERELVGEYAGELCGMLWYGAWENELVDALTLFPAHAASGEVLQRRIKEGTIAYAKEIISQKPAPGNIMALSLFRTMLRDLSARGYQSTCGEVFRVDGYDDASGSHRQELLNTASYNMLKKTGGCHIGTAKPKQRVMKDFTVHISPQIFLWDNAESEKIITGLLSAKGWRTEET